MNISANVSDRTDPLQGVSIILTDTTDNTKTFTGTTGSAGGCTLSKVTLGTYDVSATKEGYKTYSGSLTVTEETSTLTIEMETE